MSKLPKDCCGCEACAAVCKKGAIKLTRNDEGFYFPVVDASLCVNCGACEKKCPVLNSDRIGKAENTGFFGGYFTDEVKLLSSASGGFATALGEAFIKEGGIVYGAAYEEGAKSAVYKRAETVSELYGFRGSKYSQVRKKTVYADVSADLNDGKRVLFFGLPCEVAALKLFLTQNLTHGLHTVELICHGVTSEKALADFVSAKEAEYGSTAVKVNLRHKEKNKKEPHIKIDFSDGSFFIKPLYETEYGRCFQVLKRPSCNKCHFKGQNRCADMTIGDFHAVTPKMDIYNQNGVSSVIAHTEHATELIEKLEGFKLSEIPADAALNNRAYSVSIPKMSNRRSFSKVFISDGIVTAANMKSTINAEKRRKLKNKVIAYSRYLIKILAPKFKKKR